jgi:hypothetical protein
MKIRITEGHPLDWYAKYIGSVFEVATERDGEYTVNRDGDSFSFSVAKEDCEVVTEEETASTPNMVESPPHYQNARFETIEVIEEITAGYSDGFVAHCAGTAIKYIARAPFKHDDGGLEDLRKAAKYLEFAIKRIEASQSAK